MIKDNKCILHKDIPEDIGATSSSRKGGHAEPRGGFIRIAIDKIHRVNDELGAVENDSQDCRYGGVAICK